ncbi:TonB-dependent receptor [Niabella drilacis]|nr:TonB-dependent receptor [Niabella drilacis]
MAKLAIILSLVFSFQAFADNISAQTINIQLKNVSVEAALKSIEAQGSYRFVYKTETLPKNKTVSISAENATLNYVMEKILQNTALSYEFLNNALVVIVPGEASKARIITGKVADTDGKPLVGVSILEKGTTNGTASKDDGSFSLNVSAANAILVFSSLGYQAKELQAVNNMAVVLEKTDAQMDQVVIVGYGTQKKGNLTGAVSTIDFDKQSMNSRAITNVSSAMAGLAAGIRVQQANGIPSANNNASLSVRGVGSLNTSSAPLVIVDGQAADISSVSPNDVASVSILKDAASASIYGSRASNGVILITTKTGKGMNGKVNFTYNNYVGWKKPTMLPDWAYNTLDHMKLINRVLLNDKPDDPPPYDEADFAEWSKGIKEDPISYPSTNWWKAITKKNMVQDHNISARGGNDKINFYSSMDYNMDDGMIPNSAFRRVSFLNNLSYKVNDWLRLGNNVTYISQRSDPLSNEDDINSIFQWFRASSPSTLAQHPDGRYGAPQLAGEVSNNNPLRTAKQQRGETKGNRFQGKAFAVFTPLKGLSVTASYFATIFQQYSWGGSEPADLWNFKTGEITNDQSASIRTLRNNFQKNERQIIDVYADYTRSFGKHNGHLLLGYNQEYAKNQGFGAGRQGLLGYETPVFNAATGEILPPTGNASDYALRSYFGRFNYDFSGKYLFEANIRYDGSSKFAPERRWGVFPSASAGWVISREDFFQPLTSVFTSLKLRASYGQLGNNGIGNYDWQNFYSVVKYPFNETSGSALVYTDFGNPLITWEGTTVTNLGMDMRLFNRLELTLGYYNKLTQKILAKLPTPATTGGIGAAFVNSAEVRNAGFEADARYTQQLGRLGIAAAVNFAYNKNRILHYKGSFIEPHGQNAAAWTEGYPIGIFWVREVDHIIQTQQEIDDLKAAGYTFAPVTPGPGDFLYKDANGDKQINDGDRVLKGNPIPLYTYGGSLTLDFAGIDLSVYFDGVGKWDRYLQSAVYALNHNVSNFVFPTEYLNMWTPENKSTTIPKVYSGSTVNDQVSDFYLHKADYLKIRSLQLGYSLPGPLIRKMGLNKLRFFANLENYFTRTKWPNLDPEMTRSQNDDASYPLGKTASVGLQVRF